MDKLIRFFAVIFYTIEVASAGAYFADNQTSHGVASIAFAAFWLCVLLMHWMANAMRIKELKKAYKVFDEFNNDVIKEAVTLKAALNAQAENIKANGKKTGSTKAAPKKNDVKKAGKK